MALQKELKTEQGFTAEYIRIPRINLLYAVYKDHEARIEGKTPIIQASVEFSLKDLPSDKATVIYDILKSIPGMSGAADA